MAAIGPACSLFMNVTMCHTFAVEQMLSSKISALSDIRIDDEMIKVCHAKSSLKYSMDPIHRFNF